MLSDNPGGNQVSGKPLKKDERGLDMSKVQTKLDRLLPALANKLEREQLPPAIVAPLRPGPREEPHGRVGYSEGDPHDYLLCE
jgi:ParB-like chromosome segregation protein Spo0J